MAPGGLWLRGRALAAVAVVGAPAGIPGVDVSSNQDPVLCDYEALARSGVRWAYVRIGDGINLDATFRRHTDGMRAAGIATGGYQFARCRHPAADEADLVLAQVGSDAWGLAPALDLEEGGPADRLSPSAMVDWVHAWLERVGAGFGVQPIIYGACGFLDAALPRSHDLGSYGLWCAHYGVARPTLPRGWDSALAWQWSGTERVPGLPRVNDCSVWLGTETEFANFTGASTEAP